MIAPCFRPLHLHLNFNGWCLYNWVCRLFSQCWKLHCFVASLWWVSVLNIHIQQFAGPVKWYLTLIAGLRVSKFQALQTISSCTILEKEGVRATFHRIGRKADSVFHSAWRVHLLCEGTKFGSEDDEEEAKDAGYENAANKLLGVHYTEHPGYQVLQWSLFSFTFLFEGLFFIMFTSHVPRSTPFVVGFVLWIFLFMFFFLR